MTITGADLPVLPDGGTPVRCLWSRGPVPPSLSSPTPPPPRPPPPQQPGPPPSPGEPTCDLPQEGIPYPRPAGWSKGFTPMPLPTPSSHIVGTGSIVPQSPTSADATVIVCVSPPAEDASNASLTIDLGGGVTLPPQSARAADIASGSPVLDSVTGGFSYAFYRPPTLSAIEPIAGPWRGGTMLTIHGSLLQPFRGPIGGTMQADQTAPAAGAADGGPTENATANADTDALHEGHESHPLPSRTSAICRFGARNGGGPLPYLIPAEWNGTERAICILSEHATFVHDNHVT